MWDYKVVVSWSSGPNNLMQGKSFYNRTPAQVLVRGMKSMLDEEFSSLHLLKQREHLLYSQLQVNIWQKGPILCCQRLVGLEAPSQLPRSGITENDFCWMTINDGIDAYLAVIIGPVGESAQELLIDIELDGTALSDDANQVFLVQALVDRGARALP